MWELGLSDVVFNRKIKGYLKDFKDHKSDTIVSVLRLIKGNYGIYINILIHRNTSNKHDIINSYASKARINFRNNLACLFSKYLLKIFEKYL